MLVLFVHWGTYLTALMDAYECPCTVVIPPYQFYTMFEAFLIRLERLTEAIELPTILRPFPLPPLYRSSGWD